MGYYIKPTHTYIMADKSQETAGLIGGHAQYVKGATEEGIGNVTGSEEWKDSGVKDKESGVNTLKMATEQRDPTQGYGKAEELVGKATGARAWRGRARSARSNRPCGMDESSKRACRILAIIYHRKIY